MDSGPTVLTFMRVAPGTSRSLNGAQQAMLSALCANANRLAVTGVENCRTALELAERGLVTVTDGNVTRHGGSGVIAATPRRRPVT
ncbi:hypothetical protein OJ998_13675 [Solirubrobacter taibaiensis]|nr:hypothetical protein [Solirubrobacter taibaiensis]